MADVPSSLETIDINEVSYRSAVSEATQTKIAATVNALIKVGNEPLGTIHQSILTVAQFQSERSVEWVRMEGQDITGSDLHTLTGLATLPDMVSSNSFLRQASSDESNLLTYQSSNNISHSHQQSACADNFGDPPQYPLWRNVGGGCNEAGLTLLGEDSWGTSGCLAPITTVASGGSESRPVNYSINFFIKINNG